MRIVNNYLRNQSSNLYLKMSALIFSFILSFLLVYYGTDLWGGILGMGILVIVSLLLTKLDILHPLTWFTPVFYLYSISLPLLVVLGEKAYVDYRETLFLEWVALSTFIIVIGVPKNKSMKIEGNQLRSLTIVLYPIYLLSLILTSVYLGYVYMNGISSKYLLSLDNSIFRRLVPFFSIYILSFMMLLTHSLVEKKRLPVKLIIFSIIYTLIALLVIGERDLILRILLGTVFMCHLLYKRISRKKLIFLGFALLLTIPVMGDIRNAALRDNGSVSMNNNSMLYKVMTAEFGAAPRNLQLVLDSKDSQTFFYGKTYLWDIEQAFFRGNNSGGNWFNETFFPELVAIGGGNGFTIVGEGYINFGIFGVIMMFAFLAMVFKYLYNKANGNVIWLIIYITTIPITLYLIRGDLAVLFTQVSKHIILPIVLIYLTQIIISKKNPRKRLVLYKKTFQ